MSKILPLIINIVLGIWLMVSPFILNFDETKVFDFNNIAGPIIITFEIISFWEVVRPVRKANFLISILLVFLTLFTVTSLTFPAIISNIAACILIALFSLTKSNLTHSFGGGWRSLFEKYPLHLRIVKKQKSESNDNT